MIEVISLHKRKVVIRSEGLNESGMQLVISLIIHDQNDRWESGNKDTGTKVYINILSLLALHLFVIQLSSLPSS